MLCVHSLPAGLQLTPLESGYMSRLLITSGSGRQDCAGIDPGRLMHIHRVASMFQSLATTVSCLPQFPRRFTDAVTRASGSAA